MQLVVHLFNRTKVGYLYGTYIYIYIYIPGIYILYIYIYIYIYIYNYILYIYIHSIRFMQLDTYSTHMKKGNLGRYSSGSGCSRCPISVSTSSNLGGLIVSRSDKNSSSTSGQ